MGSASSSHGTIAWMGDTVRAGLNPEVSLGSAVLRIPGALFLPLPLGVRQQSLLSVLSFQHFSFYIVSMVYFGVLLLALLLSNSVTVGKMTHGLRISIVPSPANGDNCQPCC